MSAVQTKLQILMFVCLKERCLSIFAFFLAIGLAITLFPVVAQIRMEMKLTGRNVAQTISAALIDDRVG
jgi:Kef-type K+ transport system membrane component KefB